MSRLTKKFDSGFGHNECRDSCMTCCNGASCELAQAIIGKLSHYEDLEEQGRLIELPCEKVYRIMKYDSPKHAFIDSIPIVMMPIYDLKHIDNGNIFFSTKEKAETKLKEMKGAE